MNVVRQWLRQELRSRIDPGDFERQLGEDADQRLSDVAGTEQPQRRSVAREGLQQDRVLLTARGELQATLSARLERLQRRAAQLQMRTAPLICSVLQQSAND